MKIEIDSNAFPGDVTVFSLMGCHSDNYTTNGHVITTDFTACAYNVTQNADYITVVNFYNYFNYTGVDWLLHHGSRFGTYVKTISWIELIFGRSLVPRLDYVFS